MSLNPATTKPGDFVEYSDQANPGSVYVVAEVTDNPWSTFLIRSVEAPYERTATDGRQSGWKVVA